MQTYVRWDIQNSNYDVTDTWHSAGPQETGWGVLRNHAGYKDNGREIQNSNNDVTWVERGMTAQSPRPLTVKVKKKKKKKKQGRIVSFRIKRFNEIAIYKREIMKLKCWKTKVKKVEWVHPHKGNHSPYEKRFQIYKYLQ